jgi:hypothetical protein
VTAYDSSFKLMNVMYSEKTNNCMASRKYSISGANGNGRPIQWPHGLRRGPYHSYTGSQVQIPLKKWMFVLVFLCCVVLCR